MLKGRISPPLADALLCKYDATLTENQRQEEKDLLNLKVVILKGLCSGGFEHLCLPMITLRTFLTQLPEWRLK